MEQFSDEGLRESNKSKSDKLQEVIIGLSENDFLIYLLGKNIFNRTQRDIRDICKILHTKKYFQGISNPRILPLVASKLKFLQVPTGEYVYKINDAAEQYFLIIEGTVNIFIEQLVDYSTENNLIITQQQAIIKEMKVVDTKHEWESFGDVSLKQSHKRSTSAIATSNTKLIQIRRQQYSIINKALSAKDERLKYLFLSQIPLFQKVFKYSLQNFVYYLQTIECSFNQKLFRQGDAIQYIYMVIHGQFRLQKHIKPHQKLSIIKAKKNKYYNELDEELKMKSNKLKSVSFKLIGKGEILGDFEIINQIPYYEQTCTCISQESSLYRIRKKNFIDRLLSKENDIQGIHEIIQNKTFQRGQEINKLTTTHCQNFLFTTYLPVPNNRIKFSKKESTLTVKQQEKRKKIIIESQNILKKFNNTFTTPINISIKRGSKRSYTEGVNQQNRSRSKSQKVNKIPAAVTDIVNMVNTKRKYQKLRNYSKSPQLFKFEIQKIPYFIRHKYQHLKNN